MAGLDLQRVEDALARDLAAAGARYAIVRTTPEELAARGFAPLMFESDGPHLEVRVDGRPDMWISPLHLVDAEDLAGVLDQVQDVVMEAETEPWPRCPSHYHPLDPWPEGGWVVWRCPTTEAVVASFGALGR